MYECFSSRAAVAAEVRRCGGVAGALAAGLAAEQMPDGDLAWAWAELRRARDVYERAVEGVEVGLCGAQARSPARPTEPVDPDQLVPGDHVLRYTDSVERGRRGCGVVESWVPCCGRTIRIGLTGPAASAVARGACCACQMLYGCELIDDGEGGFLAEFVVVEVGILVALHRSPSAASLSPGPAGTQFSDLR